MNPLVSVIVPVFNCEPYLAEALGSIFSQNHQPLEVIVVDDGSTDGSGALTQKFRDVKLIQQENAGVSAARNTGLAAAQGDIIAWLDADDLWLSGKLACELRHFAENPSAMITLCHQHMFVTPGDAAPAWTQTPRAQKYFTHSLYATTMRREAFRIVGNFDTGAKIGEDFDWYLRAREAGLNWDVLEQVLVAHRVRKTSLTGDEDLTKRELLQIARLSLLRRRAAR